MNELEKLIARLEAVARKNDDDFCYAVEVSRGRNGWRYEFVCKETAEGHDFLNGVGTSLEGAVQAAIMNLLDALVSWGYSE